MIMMRFVCPYPYTYYSITWISHLGVRFHVGPCKKASFFILKSDGLFVIISIRGIFQEMPLMYKGRAKYQIAALLRFSFGFVLHYSVASQPIGDHLSNSTDLKFTSALLKLKIKVCEGINKALH